MRVFALWLVLGCGQAPARPCAEGAYRECEAVDLLWSREYGVRDHEAPRIAWIGTPCPSVRPGGPDLSYVYDAESDECRWGELRIDSWTIRAAWRGHISDLNVLPHELWHARLWLVFGDADANHRRPEWQSWIDTGRLQAMLQAHGL